MSFFQVLFLLPSATLCAEKKWPPITEFEFTLGVSTSADRISFSIPLRDEKGKAIYTLFGTGGSDSYLAHLSDTTKINYVGPLQLRLVEGTKDSEASLLSEDDSAPWFSRGQLHYSEIVGACGKYPEYGVLRHFRLRGFELTLQFLDIETNTNDDVVYFNLRASLRRCAGCLSVQAERPGYMNPAGKTCDKVVVGKEPIMRRGKNGSWYESKE